MKDQYLTMPVHEQIHYGMICCHTFFMVKIGILLINLGISIFYQREHSKKILFLLRCKLLEKISNRKCS